MDAILNNPTYLAIAVVLLIIIAYSIIKKLFKLGGLLVIAFIIYVAYLFNTSSDPMKEINNTLDKGKKQAEQVWDDTKDVRDKVKDIATDKDLQDKAKNTIKKLTDDK